MERSGISRKSFLELAAWVLGLGLLIFAGWMLAPRLMPPAEINASAEAGCDLQTSSCQALSQDGASISLSITPRPIKVMQPLQLAVEARKKDGSPISAEQLIVDFQGIDMNMGFNQVLLRKEAQKDAQKDTPPAENGRYVGSAVLPICITNEMLWQATVMLKAELRQINAAFRFQTKGNS